MSDLISPTAPRKPRCNPKPFLATPRKPDTKPTGYVFGRPSLYDPAYCERAIEFMSEGYSVTALAGELRVSKDTVYEWIAAHADFSAAIKKGRACRVRALETKLLSTKIGVGVTAAIFALKNADPDEWRDLYQTQTDINVRIESLSDAQLLAIAASAPKIIEHDKDEVQQANER